ncbi:L-sulfolactate dehydrogenase, partial [sediment metagenome]
PSRGPRLRRLRLRTHPKQNLKAVLADIFAHGNETSMLPGQLEGAARKRSDAAGGLLFTEAEITEFNEIRTELGLTPWDISSLPQA